MSRQCHNRNRQSISHRLNMASSRTSPTVQRTTITNIPQQLIAVLPSGNNSSSQSQGGDVSDSFNNFGASTLRSSPKPSDIWLAQEQLPKMVTDSRHTISTVCNNYLFPRIKFLNNKVDLDFSYNKKSICQHVLQRCNLAPSVDKQEWWKHNVKQLAVTMTSLRNNKTRSIRTSFYGKFCDSMFNSSNLVLTFMFCIARMASNEGSENGIKHTTWQTVYSTVYPMV